MPKLLYRDELPLLQFTGYADVVSYSAFERPMFDFEVQSFEQDSSGGCAYSTLDTVFASESFIDLEVCYGEGYECSVWIGTNGWLYWGPVGMPAIYGARLSPSWTWYGTRRYLTLNSTNILDVRPISSSSDFFPPALTFTSRPPLEFHTVDMLSGGAMRFYAGKDGSLQRYVLCANLSIASGALFVVDFQSMFQSDRAGATLLNAATNMWEFSYNRIVVGSQTSKSLPASTFVMRAVNQPPGFVVGSYSFSWDVRARALLLKFSLRDSTRTPAPVTGTTTASTAPPPTPLPTPLPTPPPYNCQRNCNGHGLCVGDDMCECFLGFVADSNIGCISADLAQTTVSRAPEVTVTIQVDTGFSFTATTMKRATEGTDAPITLIDAVSEPGTPSSTAESTKDRGFFTQPFVELVEDNYVYFAAAGGAVAALILIGVIVCVIVRRRRQRSRHTKMDEGTAMHQARDSDTHEPLNNNVSATTTTKLKTERSDYQPFKSRSVANAEYNGSTGNASNSEVYSVPMGLSKHAMREGSDEVYAVPKMGGDYKDPQLKSASDEYVVPSVGSAASAAYQEFELSPDANANKKKVSRVHEPASTADLTPYQDFDVDNTRFKKYQDD
jgi:hypothetical protein